MTEQAGRGGPVAEDVVAGVGWRTDGGIEKRDGVPAVEAENDVAEDPSDVPALDTGVPDVVTGRQTGSIVWVGFPSVS